MKIKKDSRGKNFYKKMLFGILLFFAFFLSIPGDTKAQESTGLTLKTDFFSKEVGYPEYSSWETLTPILLSDRSYFSEIENIDYCPFEKIFCYLTTSETKKIHTRNILLSDFNVDAVKKFLEKLALENDKPPVNAKFKMEEGRVTAFEIDKPGYAINIEESIAKIASSFPLPNDGQEYIAIDLPTKKIQPEIRSDEINKLGIKTLIGQGKSDFKGSTKSRMHNIKVATKRYEGLLIAPGQEFSFVETLGPVDGEHGYLPELVIKHDKTEPEFGGGICQVSTTAFRAAIYSGLEITARKNHAYPVQYYSPHGMDATIYIPRPDLKFKNNTPGHILIQTEIIGTELIFNFYGTSDGRKVEVDGPHITEKRADGSLRTTFTQKVTDKDSKVLINETFNSFYDSPSKYPRPGEEKFTKKPADWSNKQWEIYKKANGL